MNRKNGVFGVVLVLLTAVCILSGCEQSLTPAGSGSREGAFDLDSLLIEVWTNTSPPKFLGYDTGMTDNSTGSDFPIILTSTGYCVAIQNPGQFGGRKKSYGSGGADRDQGVPPENEPDDWGSMIVFATASNPTANDTPYLLAGRYSRWIENYVFYNPHDGGTYYTWAGTSYESNYVNLPAGFKLYDADGTLRTCNEATVGIPSGYREENLSFLVGNHDYANFSPLKKIGGYQALGLPNPDDLANGVLYKVKK